MRRILVLDDMQERHDVFSRSFKGCEIFHVFSAADAIEVLRTEGRFDLVHLDHDLSDEHYAACNAGRPVSDEGTGMEVVNFIATLPPEQRPKFAIAHTWNTRGEEMVRRLKEAHVPAKWERFKVPR